MKNLIKKTICLTTAILSFLFSSCIVVTADVDDLINCKYSYSNADKYSIGGAAIQSKIEKVSVDWIAGSVKVSTSSGDCIEFYENTVEVYDQDYIMRYWVDGTTLRIKFAASKTLNFSNKKKDLILTLPESYDLSNLEINTISSSVDVTDVNANVSKFTTISGNCNLDFLAVRNELNIETISGSVNLLNTSAGTVDINTVSGSINLDNTTGTAFNFETVSGSINTNDIWSETFIKSNTVSGSSNIKVLNATSVSFDSVSGSQTVCLPETVNGFTATANSLKKLNCSDFPVKIDSNRYIYGNGLIRLRFSTVSGSMNIKKF